MEKPRDWCLVLWEWASNVCGAMSEDVSTIELGKSKEVVFRMKIRVSARSRKGSGEDIR